MASIKTYSRRSFVYIFLTILVLLAATVTSLYYGLQLLDSEMASQPETAQTAGEIADRLTSLDEPYLAYGAAGLTGVFLILGLILWLGLRRTARRVVEAAVPAPAPKPSRTEPSAAQKKAAKRIEQRMFLYLLSLLQREGRLVDFFAENLEQYQDAQIGAAVRGIHENCKKTIEKNLKLAPVIDQPEGEKTRIEPGFDPHAVKLTGNVTGEPPFTGVLRHRGWRTTRLDLPTLSDVEDTGIIAPAEVEIV
jgi:hypothetical protein